MPGNTEEKYSYVDSECLSLQLHPSRGVANDSQFLILDYSVIIVNIPRMHYI